MGVEDGSWRTGDVGTKDEGRKTKDEGRETGGRHAEVVVVPYGGFHQPPWAAGAQRSVRGGGGEGWAKIGVKSIPNGGMVATSAPVALSEAGTFASAASGGKSEQKGVAAVKIL